MSDTTCTEHTISIERLPRFYSALVQTFGESGRGGRELDELLFSAFQGRCPECGITVTAGELAQIVLGDELTPLGQPKLSDDLIALVRDWMGIDADVGKPAWFGLAYVSLFSMLIGFVFWYRGLAQGGIAAVGQLQLLQPFFGLALAATLLQESVSGPMLVVTVGVILCVAGARKFAS